GGGRVETGQAGDFGVVVKLAHRDRPMRLCIVDQELGAFLHLGLGGASTLYQASRINLACLGRRLLRPRPTRGFDNSLFLDRATRRLCRSATGLPMEALAHSLSCGARSLRPNTETVPLPLMSSSPSASPSKVDAI